MESFIKISKENVDKLTTSNMTINDREFLLLTYLFFTKGIDNLNRVSLNAICGDLGYNLNSRCAKSQQKEFKKALDNLLETNYIEFYSTEYMPDYNDITDQKLFVVKVNSNMIINNNNIYTAILYNEFNTIVQAAKEKNVATHSLFNIYLILKSLINMDQEELHYCYPSLKFLRNRLECGANILTNSMNILCENKMLFIYQFMAPNIPIINNREIEFVFSIEKYEYNKVFQSFF